MITTIYLITIVPMFALSLWKAYSWTEYDLEDIGTSERTELYILCGIIAIGWPIFLVMLLIKVINIYMAGFDR